jgi:hypothetical protein
LVERLGRSASLASGSGIDIARVGPTTPKPSGGMLPTQHGPDWIPVSSIHLSPSTRERLRRPVTFLADCHAILGNAFDELERGFWEDAESQVRAASGVSKAGDIADFPAERGRR